MRLLKSTTIGWLTLFAMFVWFYSWRNLFWPKSDENVLTSLKLNWDSRNQRDLKICEKKVAACSFELEMFENGTAINNNDATEQELICNDIIEEQDGILEDMKSDIPKLFPGVVFTMLDDEKPMVMSDFYDVFKQIEATYSRMTEQIKQLTAENKSLQKVIAAKSLRKVVTTKRNFTTAPLSLGKLKTGYKDNAKKSLKALE